MKKINLVVITIALLLTITGCSTTPSSMDAKTTTTPYGVKVKEYQHSAYIAMRGDDLDELFTDVDKWLSYNPGKTVKSVVIINDRQTDSYGGFSHNNPSGALIFF